MRKRICYVAVMVTVFASSLVGQAPASSPPASVAPVQAKRVPSQTPPKASNQSPAALQSYDFGDQLRVLQDPTAMDSQKSASMPAGANAAPKGYQPRSDIPLSSTALEAVRVSETWRGGQNTPAAGSDGRVLYAYGAGLPIVVCAPLRVCILGPQAGEKSPRGAPNRRFHPMEHFASRIWPRRRINVGDRSETSGAGTRYQP